MFSWGEAGVASQVFVRYILSGWGSLRQGRLGMAIKVRCGVVSYNLKFLPNDRIRKKGRW